MYASQVSGLALDDFQGVGGDGGRLQRSDSGNENEWERDDLEGNLPYIRRKDQEKNKGVSSRSWECDSPLSEDELPSKADDFPSFQTTASSTPINHPSSFPVFPTSSPKLKHRCIPRVSHSAAVYHLVPVEMEETVRENVGALRSLLTVLDEEVEDVIVRDCGRRERREICVGEPGNSRLMRKRGAAFGGNWDE